MNAIVSMLWERNAAVMEPYLSREPAVLYAPPGHAGTNEPLRSRLAQSGIPVIILDDLLSPGILAGLKSQAAKRARRVAEDLAEADIRCAYPQIDVDPEKVRTALTARLVQRMFQGFAFLESLALAAERQRIELLIVNNDGARSERIAIAWARAHGIETLHVAHSVASNKAPTQGSFFYADVMALPTPDGIHRYDSLNIAKDKFVVTGGPSYDALCSTLGKQAKSLADARVRLGLPPAAPIVVFAATWYDGFDARLNPKFTSILQPPSLRPCTECNRTTRQRDFS